MELSVIIVNYNGLQFLQACFNSVKQSCKDLKFEIIVVDNASKDGSVLFIKTHFPNIKLIASDENLGFAKGNNLGVSLAKYKNILLLNNDTILKSKLKEALKYFEEDPEIGALGIKMKGKKEEFRLSVGHFPTPIRFLKLSKLYFDYDFIMSCSEKAIEVDWIEGSFLLTQKKLWDEIGGLDETYFMYVEDMDYCKALKVLEKKRIYFSQAEYIHFGGYNSGREQLLQKGFVKYINKYHKGFFRYFCLLSLNLNFTFKNVKKTISKRA